MMSRSTPEGRLWGGQRTDSIASRCPRVNRGNGGVSSVDGKADGKARPLHQVMCVCSCRFSHDENELCRGM